MNKNHHHKHHHKKHKRKKRKEIDDVEEFKIVNQNQEEMDEDN